MRSSSSTLAVPVAVLTSLCLVVTACSAGGGGQAGERFTKMTEESDCAGDAYQTVGDSIADRNGKAHDDDWPEIESRLLPSARAYAAALDQLASEVDAADWPSGSAEMMEAYAAETRAWAKHFHRVGAASTMQEWIAANGAEAPPDEEGARVRKALGLDEAPHHTHEFCLSN